MRLHWLVAIMLAGVCGGGAAGAQPPGGEAAGPVDLMTIAEGAILVSASANAHAALALTDGSAKTHWSNEGKRDKLPYRFVFELRAPTKIAQVGVVGGGKRPGGVQGGAARGIVVEASSAGPGTGFREIAAFDAAEEGETLAAVGDATPFRWVRLVVASNHGSPIWTYFNEVVLHGEQAVPAAAPRFAGIFETGRKAFIELKQDGISVSGCYTEQAGHSGGTLQGDVDGGVARVSWVSDKGIGGSALFALDSTGKLSGVRYRDRSRSAWGGGKAPAGTTTPCSRAAVPANPMADALRRDGTVRIYGLLFDFDKATLRPESRRAQDMLLDLLRRDAALALVIEGHTDSAGGDDYNRALSQRRAETVAGWLVAQGIAAGRVQAVGRGEASPVASNDTADGRALNRRVEAVRR